MTFRSSFVSIALASTIVGPASGSIIDVLWVGPDGGAWNVASHWDSGKVFPNNGGGNEYHAVISTKFGLQVNLPTNVTVSNLTVGAADELRIENARSLTVSALNKSGGVINNAGVIELASTGTTTLLRPADGVVTLTGGGTLRMSNHAANQVYRMGATGSLVNQDNTIEGAGRLGLSSVPTDITNQHLIIANATTPMQVSLGSALLTNTGEMRAEDGGTLQLTGGTYDNTGGIIEAQAGSTVDLSGNANITGGLLRSVDDGMFVVSTNTPWFTDLDHAAHTFINNARSLHLSGAIHNTGMFEMGSTGSNTYIQPVGLVTLTGGGTVRMSDSPGNLLYRSGATGSIINVDNVFEGAGRLGWSSLPTDFTNQHLVIANATNALQLDIGSALLTNTGEMRAEDGATLQFLGGTYDNTGGIIEARAGSLVTLSGNANITGGLLRSVDDGMFVVTTSTPHLIDVDHAAHTFINNSRTLLLSGDIHNTGMFEMGSTGTNTYLKPVGLVTLTGGGTVRMSDSPGNWLYRDDAIGAIVNVDNVFEGAGRIGWSALPTDFTNQHLIIANVENMLTINSVGALFTNEGELRAIDGGTLQVEGGTYDNSLGLIKAYADSTVNFSGNAVITGGTIEAEGNGVVQVTANTPHLHDVTLLGEMTITNARTMRASGTLNNTGELILGSTGSSTYLRPIDGPLTLTGGGTIRMSDRTSNWIYRDGDSHIINQDNTIRGSGNLGWTSLPTGVINAGSIIADGENQLTIAPDAIIGFANTGMVHLQGTGGLQIAGGMMNQQGTVIIDADSLLTRASGHFIQTAGVTSVNGSITTTGSGNQVQIQGGVLNGTGTVLGVLNNSAGTVNPGLSAGLLTVNGTYMQGGVGVLAIEIEGDDPIADHDVLHVNGHAQLGGYLQPQFDEAYTPEIGTQWTVLTADTMAGTFNAVAPCESIRVLYVDGAVVIEKTGVVRVADLNCDGLVDVSDLLVLLSAWGNSAEGDICPANLNGDDAIDVSDLLILLANWG